MTVAAPLVLMAVAVGASAYADQRRQKAIEHIAELLEKLHDDVWTMSAANSMAAAMPSRRPLRFCWIAAESARRSALTRLFTQSAPRLKTPSVALKKWEAALGAIVDNRAEPSDLEADFPGIGAEGGEFRAHLEFAALAIALKRRVVVLQAVEAGQGDLDNPFENFLRSLNEDHQRIDEFEARIPSVLLRLSALELRPPKRLIDKLMTRRQVENLFWTLPTDSGPWARANATAQVADVVIEIEKHDGTLLRLPTRAALEPTACRGGTCLIGVRPVQTGLLRGSARIAPEDGQGTRP